MATVPEIIPVTDLRQDAAAVLKRVQAAHQPLVITQRGRAAAIMLSVEAYERGERERQLLRLLVRGEHEIAAGMGYDLDAVWAEADTLRFGVGGNQRDELRGASASRPQVVPSFSPLSPIYAGRTHPQPYASGSGRSRPYDGRSSFRSRVEWYQSSLTCPTAK